jgi:putative ABC transport system permease protein
MFKLNLKIALRNLWKYKGYTLINITGLSIGMASCIMIFIFIRYQTSFDQDFANKDRIYRLVSYWKYADGEEHQKGVPRPLPSAVRNDFAQLEQVAPLQRGGGIVNVKDAQGLNRIKEEAKVFYTEPAFFKIFSYKWLQGSPDESLTMPNTVVLSEKTASRYFGDWRKAVGQTINYKNKIDFKVTGVFENVPENSSNPLEIVFSYASYPERLSKSWGSVSSNSECYVLLRSGVNISDLRDPMLKFIKKHYQENSMGKEDHIFQPLSQVHYDERYGNFAEKVIPPGQLWGLGIIGLFLMITACINFINLATAQAVNRSKEVGVRKVMGSLRSQLIAQFLTETLIITLVALGLACALTELALPAMEHLFQEKISFSIVEHPIIFVFLLGLVLLVSFLAGFYPALVLSGFSPALAIKNKISAVNSGGIGLRKVLVVVQFSITIVLIIGTLVVLNQMNYIREKPLGFNAQAIALVNIPRDSISAQRYELFKERVLKLPGVSSASFCTNPPSSGDNNFTNFAYNGTTDENFQVNTKPADADYFKTFDLKFIAGRASLPSDTAKEYVVNETLLKKLNISDPNEAIGKLIKLGGSTPRTIAGVVKDFNNLTLREAISPIVIFSSKMNTEMIAVKMQTGNIKSLMPQIEKMWHDTFPEYVYDVTFMDEVLDGYYKTEQVMGVLFKTFAGVIIFISFIGLFGLISFVASQRTREVAIRKVLGASTIELVKMLNGTFLFMVFFANLIAWPVAFILVDKWLSGYTYRIGISIWPFLIAMLISMLVTLFTVSLRSFKAARTNPIDALKYE